jgi:ubiquitin-like protein Pup
MPRQTRKQRPTSEKKSDEEVADSPAPDPKATGEQLKQDIDEILDEIEAVLDTSAEFVSQYVQKGGQ